MYFLFSVKHTLWYSLEVPHRCASNYNVCFHAEIRILHGYIILSGAMNRYMYLED